MAMMQENPRVTQSNQLVEASYSLSLTEKRLLVFCISQIKKDLPVTSGTSFKISYNDYVKLFGLRKGAYANLKKAANRLYERTIIVPLYPESGKLSGSDKDTNVEKFRWVSGIKLNDKDYCVELMFSEQIIPYLQKLESKFTSYHLDDVVGLTSEHTIRFYEFASQWKNKGKVRLEIDWVRQKLGIEDKYPQPRDFRRFILEPAASQISETTPLDVDFELIKTGRRVTHIDLRIVDTKLPLSKRFGLS